MYKLIIWKAIWTDSGPETGTESFIMNYKPTFQEMYKHLSTDMIEITKGYDKDISDRSFDMYIDRQCLPGDFIAGHVAIIKRIKNDKSRSNEAA